MESGFPAVDDCSSAEALALLRFVRFRGKPTEVRVWARAFGFGIFLLII